MPRTLLVLLLHLSETKKEVKYCLKKYKLRPVEFLEKIGLVKENTIFAHSIWLSEKEIKILGKRKANLVYCPCANLKLGSGFFPYKKIRKAGINISLGTDGPASNNNLDLFEEIKLASLIQKGKEANPQISPAGEILETATKNGAKALKINNGEIKEGKLADLILIDLNQVCLTPGHNLISDLVYSGNGSCVSDVICNSRILMEERN